VFVFFGTVEGIELNGLATVYTVCFVTQYSNVVHGTGNVRARVCACVMELDSECLRSVNRLPQRVPSPNMPACGHLPSDAFVKFIVQLPTHLR